MNTHASSSHMSTGRTLTGAETLVQALVREGVDVVFAYPGGASLPIHQALDKEKSIRTILPRHEQGGAFAAEGYGRSTGKVGVCISTSGPGATNMITPIADAFLDSTPMVAITAQVPRAMIGRGAFQETDIFGMTAPVVKHSYLITDPNDIPRIIKEAFYIAASGRPGPVVIDVPKDCMELSIEPNFNVEIDLPGYRPTPVCQVEKLKALMPLILAAKRPALYVGGGIITAEASEELLEFAQRAQIPVATTLMGIGAFPESHSLALRWLGMHGAVYANNAVNEADLVIALGARFDDRVTGNVKTFAEHATIIHVDIDNAELNKNRDVDYAIISDVKQALQIWNEELRAINMPEETKHFTRNPEWLSIIKQWKEMFVFSYPDQGELIAPQSIIETLYEKTKNQDIFMTTGVGQHQMWAAQFYKFENPRRLATSGGLGSMGYGLPAAMGVQMAHPDKLVINIDGDGSFLMNAQELATIKVEKMPIKCIIVNNQHLGMVVQWEDLKYDSVRAQSFLADPADNYDATHKNEDIIYPNYPLMCASFGIPCERIVEKKDLSDAIDRMLKAEGPYILDIMVPYAVHVLPIILGGMGYKDVILDRISGDGTGRSVKDLGKEIPTAL